MKLTNFHYETDFKLGDESAYRKWVQAVIASEGRKEGELNYIFSTDENLHKININYLKHNTLTDIISFDYSEGNVLGGDIFISVERVRENAETYKVSFSEELLRVMAHGLLHYCGYKDKTEEDTALMRKKEDEKIAMFHVKQNEDDV